MKAMQATTVRLPLALHRRLRIKCLEFGISLSHIVRLLLLMWLEGRIDLSQELSHASDQADRQEDKGT